MNTTDLDFHPNDAFSWQYREVLTAEAALHVDALRFSVNPGFTHAFGLKAGAAWLRQWRESPFMVLSPSAVEDATRFGTLAELAERPDVTAFHLFRTEEGTYGVATTQDNLSTPGWLLGLYYTTEIGRAALGADVTYREHRSGATLFDYGLHVGYRF